MSPKRRERIYEVVKALVTAGAYGSETPGLWLWQEAARLVDCEPAWQTSDPPEVGRFYAHGLGRYHVTNVSRGEVELQQVESFFRLTSADFLRAGFVGVPPPAIDWKLVRIEEVFTGEGRLGAG